MSPRMVLVNGFSEIETEARVLIDVGLEKDVWFPKSQIEEIEPGVWEMPEWLAMEKGVI